MKHEALKLINSSLVAPVKLSIKIDKSLPFLKTVKFNSSQQVFDFILRFFDSDDMATCELFYVIYLNQDNQLIAYANLSRGSTHATLADPTILFAYAFQVPACRAFILVHNHPSGNKRPSETDKRLTKKIKQLADLFEMTVLDHLIIVPDGGYFSFADEGIL